MVQAALCGVTGLPGLLGGDPKRVLDPAVRACTGGVDAMHGCGSLAMISAQQAIGRLAPDLREAAEKRTVELGVKKPKMRCSDQVRRLIALLRPDFGVKLPELELKHAAALLDLRRLFYALPHRTRSRGWVLALICALIKWLIAHSDNFKGEVPLCSASTAEVVSGHYFSGCINLALSGRMEAPVQSNCELGEKAFKEPKELFHSRSNYHLDQSLTLLVRFLLASSINEATNTVASEAARSSDSDIKAAFEKLNLGPAKVAGLNGESRYFSAAEVHSVFFVLMWLMWLPDYLEQSEVTWFKDDEVPYSAEKNLRVGGATPVIISWGVRPTTIICDFNATSGAVLYDSFWMTEPDMQRSLLAKTKKIVAHPERFKLPGWQSVQKALDFLKAASRGDGVRAESLRSFLTSAGM